MQYTIPTSHYTQDPAQPDILSEALLMVLQGSALPRAQQLQADLFTGITLTADHLPTGKTLSAVHFPIGKTLSAVHYPTGKTLSAGHYPTGKTISAGHFHTRISLRADHLPSGLAQIAKLRLNLPCKSECQPIFLKKQDTYSLYAKL